VARTVLYTKDKNFSKNGTLLKKETFFFVKFVKDVRMFTCLNVTYEDPCVNGQKVHKIFSRQHNAL
jgi:hypothetical protein